MSIQVLLKLKYGSVKKFLPSLLLYICTKILNLTPSVLGKRSILKLPAMCIESGVGLVRKRIADWRVLEGGRMS